MKFKPKTILNCVIKIGKLFCLWPLDTNAKFITRSTHELTRFIFILNEIMFVVPLFLSAYHHVLDDPQEAIKAFGNSGSHFEDIFNLILWKTQQNQLRGVLSEAVDYIQKINDKKEHILEKYLIGYLKFHMFTVICCMITFSCYTISPLFLPQILPDTTWYPFEIEIFTLRYYYIYFSQVIAMFQNVIIPMLGLLIIIIMLSTVTTKLHILSLKIEKTKNENDLKKHFRKHQKIIEYAEKLNCTMRFIILKSYVTIAVSTIFSAIQIFFSNNFFNVIEATLYITTCLFGAFTFAWAADDMHQASMDIQLAIYNSNWIECTPEMRKVMIIMMCRAQKSLNISIDGILPALTLEFFANFLMFIISYFMMLRALIK